VVGRRSLPPPLLIESLATLLHLPLLPLLTEAQSSLYFSICICRFEDGLSN